MRNLIITFCLLISAITYSQSAENNFPSIVEQKTAYFYKDNLKPFTGNLIFKDNESNLITNFSIIFNRFNKHFIRFMVNFKLD